MKSQERGKADPRRLHTTRQQCMLFDRRMNSGDGLLHKKACDLAKGPVLWEFHSACAQSPLPHTRFGEWLEGSPATGGRGRAHVANVRSGRLQTCTHTSTWHKSDTPKRASIAANGAGALSWGNATSVRVWEKHWIRGKKVRLAGRCLLRQEARA